jgi:hypothetical protein
MIRPYASTEPVRFQIWEVGGAEPYTGSLVAGDVKISKDNGAVANVTNLPTRANGQWSWTPTAAEMTAKVIMLIVDDQDGPAFATDFAVIETYGHASALHTPAAMAVNATLVGGVAPETGATVAAATWNAAMASHLTAGTTGAKLNDAGAGGTPPTTAQIVTAMDTTSAKLDVAVSSRLAAAAYTTPPTAAQNRQEMDANSMIRSEQITQGVALTTIMNATDTLEASAATIAGYTDTVENGITNLANSIAALPGANAIRDAVHARLIDGVAFSVVMEAIKAYLIGNRTRTVVGDIETDTLYAENGTTPKLIGVSDRVTGARTVTRP